MDGIFAIKKPVGPTSHDVVARIRKLSGVKKVGHAGTLDPLAEGVLVVGIGREATRELGKIVEGDKEYFAQIVLGQVSKTDDGEGPIEKIENAKIPSEQNVTEVLTKFLGKIKQYPPKHSAVKIYGRRAYQKARKGEDFKMPPRLVEVFSLELMKYVWPKLEIETAVSSGTYIRSLARDIGQELGTGGYLAGLMRTRVGKYLLKDAIDFEKFCEILENESDKNLPKTR